MTSSNPTHRTGPKKELAIPASVTIPRTFTSGGTIYNTVRDPDSGAHFAVLRGKTMDDKDHVYKIKWAFGCRGDHDSEFYFINVVTKKKGWSLPDLSEMPGYGPSCASPASGGSSPLQLDIQSPGSPPAMSSREFSNASSSASSAMSPPPSVVVRGIDDATYKKSLAQIEELQQQLIQERAAKKRIIREFEDQRAEKESLLKEYEDLATQHAAAVRQKASVSAELEKAKRELDSAVSQGKFIEQKYQQEIRRLEVEKQDAAPPVVMFAAADKKKNLKEAHDDSDDDGDGTQRQRPRAFSALPVKENPAALEQQLEKMKVELARTQAALKDTQEKLVEATHFAL